MEMSRNISIKKLENVNLNNMSNSYHEGIYSFSSDISVTNNNFPANGIAGFLFINTDFDDTVCIQRITTMGRKFYFRTGNKIGSIFVWSDWDRYASIADIPAKSVRDLEKDFITKEEFYPKQGDSNFLSGNPNVYYVEQELDSVLQNIYKYYGTYTNESLYDIRDILNNTDGIYRNKDKIFAIGYFVRDKDLEEDVQLIDNAVPTRKAGLLQVFSSIYLSENQAISEADIIERGHIFRTFIFHEFETGDVLVTRTFMDTQPAIIKDRYYTELDDNPNRNLLKWDRYSYSKVRSYNLNREALDFLKIRNRQDFSIRLSGINTVTNDYDNNRNEEYLKKLDYRNITPINEIISWNDDTDANIITNDRPIPYFNNSITDKDFSIITSMSPTGTFFRYPKVGNEFIKASTYGRLHSDSNDSYIVTPVWNTFNITYNVLKITKDRFRSEVVEKVD